MSIILYSPKVCIFQRFDDGIFRSVNFYICYVGQFLGFLYTLISSFWVLYVIGDLLSQIRNRRRLITLTSLESDHDYKNRLFLQREAILRNSIFLAFLFFELIFSLSIIFYGVLIYIISWFRYANFPWF